MDIEGMKPSEIVEELVKGSTVKGGQITLSKGYVDYGMKHLGVQQKDFGTYWRLKGYPDRRFMLTWYSDTGDLVVYDNVTMEYAVVADTRNPDEFMGGWFSAIDMNWTLEQFLEEHKPEIGNKLNGAGLMYRESQGKPEDIIHKVAFTWDRKDAERTRDNIQAEGRYAEIRDENGGYSVYARYDVTMPPRKSSNPGNPVDEDSLTEEQRELERLRRYQREGKPIVVRPDLSKKARTFKQEEEIASEVRRAALGPEHADDEEPNYEDTVGL